jgi:hypothetical protein
VAGGLERLDRRGDRVEGVGPHVAGQVEAERQQVPVGVHRRLDPQVLLAGVGRGQQVLAPVLDPADWPPQP